jgi:MSHA biogenesis protein MshJ
VNKTLQQWADKINALNQRERVLIFLIVAVVVAWLVVTLLLDPLLKQQQIMTSQLQQLHSQSAQLNNEQVILAAELSRGVHHQAEQRRQQLQQELERINQNIESSIVALIPPRLMAQVLESVLVENRQLKLLALENKPVVKLLAQQDENNQSANNKHEQLSADTGQALYKHTFVLTLQGNYAATVSYFEKLASLPWRFHWDDLRYEVDNYPNAVITLEVHTVSLSEDWIGV